MDIDKLIRMDYVAFRDSRFGSLMDIDKLIPAYGGCEWNGVLVL